MDEAISVLELALFPLNTVLFPGQVLPLHIFEERYRLMIRRCLAEDLPFGVVLLRHGREVGEAAEPHLVGTVARIIRSSLQPDGTMDIITVGQERFRIRHLIHDQPYLRGEVETLVTKEASDSGTLTALSEAVRDRIATYIKLIAEAAGLQIQIDEMPAMPHQVGYLAAAAMQIDNREKQDLLAGASLEFVLTSEIRLLNRENALLRWMAARRDWPGEAQFGPSGTLLPN
jgi:Lon protease-like protein